MFIKMDQFLKLHCFRSFHIVGDDVFWHFDGTKTILVTNIPKILSNFKKPPVLGASSSNFKEIKFDISDGKLTVNLEKLKRFSFCQLTPLNANNSCAKCLSSKRLCQISSKEFTLDTRISYPINDDEIKDYCGKNICWKCLQGMVDLEPKFECGVCKEKYMGDRHCNDYAYRCSCHVKCWKKECEQCCTDVHDREENGAIDTFNYATDYDNDRIEFVFPTEIKCGTLICDNCIGDFLDNGTVKMTWKYGDYDDDIV